MIQFNFELKSGVPIYEQVVYAVKKAIVTGKLREGDRFPSVRELSKELRINPNTALKIVNHLVQDKILIIQPGIGSIVSEKNIATPEQRNQILNDEVERLVVEAKGLSINLKDVLNAIEQQWQETQKGHE